VLVVALVVLIFALRRELGQEQTVRREELAHSPLSPTLFFSNTRSAR
jgi:hypothetical protein